MARSEIPEVKDVKSFKQGEDSPFLDSTYFNNLRTQILLSAYLGDDNEEGDDLSNLTCSFDNTTSQEPLTSGEKLKMFFAKIKMIFSSIKSIAFKNKLNSSDIGNKQITSDKLKDFSIKNDKISDNISGEKIYKNSLLNSTIKDIKVDKIKVPVPEATTVKDYDKTEGSIKDKFLAIDEEIKKYQIQEGKIKDVNGSELNISINQMKKQGDICIVHFEVSNAAKGELPASSQQPSVVWNYKLPFAVPFQAAKMEVPVMVYSGNITEELNMEVSISNNDLRIVYSDSYVSAFSLKSIRFFIGSVN